MRCTTALACLCLALLASRPAPAAESPPPSEASLRELIEVVDARKLLEGMSNQADAMVQASLNKAPADESLTPQQRKILDDMRARMLALLHEELSWATYEPLFLDVYARSFSQQEVDGMLAFYRSDAGRAVIAKMPLVLRNTLQLVQSRMEPLRARLKQLSDEAIAELKATRTTP